jgi:hypothetical protein
MANTLKIRRGTKAGLPTLAAGEPGWCTDTYEMYVGDGATNRLLKTISLICDNGTTFPASPVVGQWFYRTDIKTLFLYEAAWKPIISFGAVTLYVDATNGTDGAGYGYGSGANAVKTINYALGLVPATNGGDVTINITAETYAEDVAVQGKGFSGPYSLKLKGTLVQNDAGTATSADAYAMGAAGAGAIQAKLNDTAKAWTVNAYQNKVLEITGGTGYTSTAGEEWKNFYIIDSNTETQLVIVGEWKVATPNNTTTYKIKSFGAVIDGGASRANCIRINNQKGLILENLSCKAATVNNILIDTSSEVALRTVHVECADLSNVICVQVQGYSTILCTNLLFLKNGTVNSGFVFMRLQGGAAPKDNNALIGCKFDGNSKMNNGIICAAMSFVNNGIYGCLFKNFLSQAINTNSLSRNDIANTIIKSPGNYGLYVDQSNFILRGGVEISGAASHGIYGTSLAFFVIGTGGVGTSQVNNNGGWGARFVVLSKGSGVSGLSYTGNTSGTYSADSATYALVD